MANKYEAKKINGIFVIVCDDGHVEDRDGKGYKSLDFAEGVAKVLNNPEWVRPSDGRDI